MKKPETSASAGSAADPTPLPRIRLNSLEAIGREMRLIYRMARHGRMLTQDASRLTFLLTQIAALIEVTTLETRLTELERRSDEISQRTPVAIAHRAN